MIRVILATKNKAKYASVARVVKFVAQKNGNRVQLNQVAPQVSAPVENGQSAAENCRIKTQYYQSYIQEPFIVCDDAIYAPRLLNDFPDYDFHRFGGRSDSTPTEIFTRLQQLMTTGSRYPVTIYRYFGCVNQGRKTYFHNTFHGLLMPVAVYIFRRLLRQKITDNPLNYFIHTRDAKRLSGLNSESVTMIYSSALRTKLQKFISSLPDN